MRFILAVMLGAAVLLAAGPVRAQQEEPEVVNGALMLEPGDGVELISQELHISRDAIRSRSVFRNRTAAEVTRTLVFAAPDRTSVQDARILSWPRSPTIEVDDRPETMRAEYRALLGDQDHSETLTRLNIPIDYFDAAFAPVRQALGALPAADQARLVALGLVDVFDPDDGPPEFTPLWTVRAVWRLEQVFPAGRDVVVEHGYAPGLGGVIEVGLSSQPIRDSESGRAMIARYCLGEGFLAGLDRIAVPQEGADYPSVGQYQLAYAPGPMPIGAFRLVVDRGQPDALAGFCGEDVREAGPTQVEMRRSNWQPAGPLHILFMAVQPAE